MMRRFRALSTGTRIILVSLLVGGSAGADEPHRLEVQLSRPQAPVRVHVHHPAGDVRVIAHRRESVEVLVAADGGSSAEIDSTQDPGLRVLSGDPLDVELLESDNTVWLRSAGGTSSIVVGVPRRSAVKVHVTGRGDVDVLRLDGEVEVFAARGNVRLAAISGPAMVSAYDGDIAAVFRVVPPGAISLISRVGDVEAVFPADLAADVSMTASDGVVRTDFAVERLPAAISTGDPAAAARLRREVRVRIGGGGLPIRLESRNGSVTLRRYR